MKNKKTIFDFFSQGFCLYGVMVIIISGLSVIVGERSKEISSMFLLGNKGLSTEIIFQLFVIALLITGARFIYFNDVIVKRTSIAVRTAMLLLTVVGIIILFICSFGWFPVDMWQPWLLFLGLFGILFLLGTAIAFLKEKTDNKNMEEALRKLKEKQIL